MSSIIRFLSGDPNWILSSLNDVDPKLAGTAANRFLDKESSLYIYRQRIENLTLPITVLRCDYSKKTHTSYLFTIFHRLNTGAMKLNNQEIRNCIYSGTFNDLINDLNRNPEWLKLNRMRKDTGYRFRGQELILRFFALVDNVDKYGGRLATFLNEYMADNRNLGDDKLDSKKLIFEDSLHIVFAKIFDSKAPAKQPLSIMEATLVGVAKNLSSLKSVDADAIKRMHKRMLENEEFSPKKLNEGLAGKERVKGRIKAAIASFSISD